MPTDPGKELDTVQRRQGEGRRPGQSGVAMIAGAGDGLGIALARACLDAGFSVHVVGRSLSRLQQRMTTLAGAGDRLACHQADLRDPFAVDALFKQVSALHGAPDLVVFNAGAQYRKPFIDITPEMFEQVWKLSCYAGFLVGQAAARAMLPRQSGSIIFSGATASIRGASAFAAFSSAKFGLRAVAQSMARELGPKGLHVANVVIDGVIDMPRTHERFPDLRASTTEDGLMQTADIAQAYLSLHHQPRNAWSHEIDLRPWCEKF